MNIPSYRQKYQIKSIRSPVMLQHTSIHNREIKEYEEIVVSTSSFSTDELKQMYNLSWAFSIFHKFGIFEHISSYYNQIHGLPFMEFYEILLDYCKDDHKSIFSQEFKKMIEVRDNGYAGKGWDHHDPKLGEIIWPIVEASWLRLTFDKSKMLDAINLFLSFLDDKLGYKTSKKILNDLIKFQAFVQTTRDNKEEIKSENFEYNWKDFFVNKTELKKEKMRYYYKNPIIESDQIKWSYKVAWYGRRSEKYKCHAEHLHEKKYDKLLENQKIDLIISKKSRY